jgi:hypothetical protein
MALAHSQNAAGLSLFAAVKSILIWSFVLAVCMIVVGFPILVLVVSVASIAVFAMHAFLPANVMLLAIAGFIGLHIVGILAVSTYLTAKGMYPQDVNWMVWLRGQENPSNTAIYASCPLTCDINSSPA